jgi:hypothetical protein
MKGVFSQTATAVVLGLTLVLTSAPEPALGKGNEKASTDKVDDQVPDLSSVHPQLKQFVAKQAHLLAGLNPKLRELFLEFQKRHPGLMYLHDGCRSKFQQQEAMNRGATPTLFSGHLFGIAFDGYPLKVKKNVPAYRNDRNKTGISYDAEFLDIRAKMVVVAKDLGIQLMIIPHDLPHFELSGKSRPAPGTPNPCYRR